MIRHLTNTWPAWIAVAISILAIAAAAGGLIPRIAYCETQISNLSGLPIQVARVEERLIAQDGRLAVQQAQLDRIERGMARQREE